MKETIEKIRTSISIFDKKYHELLSTKQKQLEVLLNITNELNESSSKSWIGFQATLYFMGFQRPTSIEDYYNSEWGSLHEQEKWFESNDDKISQHIEKNANGISINSIREELNPIIEEFVRIKNDAALEMVIINDNKRLAEEWNNIQDIEKLSVGISARQYTDSISPKQFMSRDSLATQQGIWVPPHISYQARVVEAMSKIKYINDTIKNVIKILKIIELKDAKYSRTTNDCSVSTEDNVLLLCKKLRAVSEELKQRYNGRNTLLIQDEYDVQNLLHALLKIFYDDIRTEEYTPSYAGGSSRMDFVINAANIVIENKMSRAGLNAKKVGEELIIDIAKYRKHPKCKTLICFVYDPDGIIRNPHGLETDLCQLSTEEMKVIVLIEPK